MKTVIFKFRILLLLLFVYCCNESKTNGQQTNIIAFDEREFVLDDSYSLNDARRYGLTAETALLIHPVTKKNRLESVLDIAEKSGVEIIIPSGYYKANLVIKNRSNLKLKFNNSEFNLIHIITSDTLSQTSNINLKGKLTSYANLGIISARDIEIDTVIIKSNITKNLWNMRCTGAHIYKDTKNVKIKYLEVLDVGSGDIFYKNAHAAVSIDGGVKQPENIQIENIYIQSSDRHGIYITGNYHLMGDVVIEKFGAGDANDMTGMPYVDNENNENKDFKALWVNKCYNSSIENLTINEKDSKAKYTAHFDAGDKERPFIIGKFKIINDNPEIEVLEEEGSGVVIEIMDK